MGTYITANVLDQIGLILGFISGLLLIPEVFNLLPTEKLEISIESQLSSFENWATRFPLRFTPSSWRYLYTEEQRTTVIEPKTAIRTLIFSIVWIVILVLGIRTSSQTLIGLSVFIVTITAFGGVIRIHSLWPKLSVMTLVLMFIVSVLLLVFGTPLISVIRVILLVLRRIAATMSNYFSKKDVLRWGLTLLAIIAFIASNVLQFIATLL